MGTPSRREDFEEIMQAVAPHRRILLREQLEEEQNPLKTVDALVIAYEAEKNPMLKGKYLQRMVALAQASGRFKDYSNATSYMDNIGRAGLRDKLLEDMLSRFPVRGFLWCLWNRF